MDAADWTDRRRDLWLTRLYYLIFFGGLGFASPFLNLFYSRLGLNGTEIGGVAAISSLVALVIAPVWTSKNDRWRNPRAMLQASLVIFALSYFWLSQQTMFLGIALVSVFRTLFGAAIGPLSDSLALSVTGAVRKGFGTVRVWASLGWVILVLLSGWLVQQTGLKTALIGTGITSLVGVLLLFPIGRHNFSGPQGQGQGPVRLRAVARNVLRRREMVGVGLMLVVIGVANSGVAQFEPVYLDALGAEESLIGVAGMLSAVVELPFMLFADRLGARRGSYWLLLRAMLLTGSVRALVLIHPAIATILAERALGGIAFSFYTVGLIRFLGEQAPPHEMRTVMALYTVTLPSLIGIVAPPIAGTAFDWFGARWLYAVAVAGYLLGWLCLWRANRPVPSLAGETVPAAD